MEWGIPPKTRLGHLQRTLDNLNATFGSDAVIVDKRTIKVTKIGEGIITALCAMTTVRKRQGDLPVILTIAGSLYCCNPHGVGAIASTSNSSFGAAIGVWEPDVVAGMRLFMRAFFQPYADDQTALICPCKGNNYNRAVVIFVYCGAVFQVAIDLAGSYRTFSKKATHVNIAVYMFAPTTMIGHLYRSKHRILTSGLLVTITNVFKSDMFRAALLGGIGLNKAIRALPEFAWGSSFSCINLPSYTGELHGTQIKVCVKKIQELPPALTRMRETGKGKLSDLVYVVLSELSLGTVTYVQRMLDQEIIFEDLPPFWDGQVPNTNGEV